ncbi:MAG: SRPBCC family protein [Bacteroidota bacterium]
MVRFLKYLGILAGLLIVLIIVWLSTLDGKYDTFRSRTINAPAEIIFGFVDDYKEWPKWDPWTEAFGDNMEVSYSGNKNGVGAKYTWKGEESGEGNMETIGSSPYSSIDQVINFLKPFESSSDIYWQFEETEKGTKVTWGMKGEMPFYMRWMAAAMDENMEKDLLRGLEKLDSISVLASQRTQVSE